MGWVEVLEESTGRTVYVHETGAVSLTRPEGSVLRCPSFFEHKRIEKIFFPKLTDRYSRARCPHSRLNRASQQKKPQRHCSLVYAGEPLQGGPALLALRLCNNHCRLLCHSLITTKDPQLLPTFRWQSPLRRRRRRLTRTQAENCTNNGPDQNDYHNDAKVLVHLVAK